MSAALDLSDLGLTPEEEARVRETIEMLSPKLFDGQRLDVPSQSSKKGATYELYRKGGTLSCSCMAWRIQTIPIQFRTCKHLGAHLGVAAEAERVREAAKAAGRRLPSNVRPNRSRR